MAQAKSKINTKKKEKALKKTRKQKRAAKQAALESSEAIGLLKKYLVDSEEAKLESVSDGRDKGRCKYTMKVILVTAIFGFMLLPGSMRRMEDKMNTEEAIANVYEAARTEPLDEIPSADAIRNALEKSSAKGIENLKRRFVRPLLRDRNQKGMFRRVFGKLIVAVDATRRCKYSEKGDGRLHCTHNKGEKNERTEVFDIVIEAKVIFGGIAISLCSVLCAYEGEHDKQACELACAEKLIKGVRQLLPGFEICICADSLYVSSGFLALARKLRMDFIVRYKTGSASTVESGFLEALRKGKNAGSAAFASEDRQGAEADAYSWAAKLKFGDGCIVNYVEMERFLTEEEAKAIAQKHSGGASWLEESEWGPIQRFAFVTSFKAGKATVQEIVAAGRSRWLIESSFREQKQELSLRHAYSLDSDVEMSLYSLMQIAHALARVAASIDSELAEALGIHGYWEDVVAVSVTGRRCEPKGEFSRPVPEACSA